MATVREFVNQKLGGFGLQLAEVELDILLADAGIDTSGEPVQYSELTARAAKVAILKAIPELLLRPDVTEGGFSVKLDRAAITRYYGLLCNELGLVNQLNPTNVPTVSDASYLW